MRADDPERPVLDWQDRWKGLADALERALDNVWYRTLMCFATIVLVLVYVIIGTRSVEPTVWPQNQWVEFRNSQISTNISFQEWDKIERAARNIEKLYRAISWDLPNEWRPTPIQIDVSYFFNPTLSDRHSRQATFAKDSYAIEAHVLRLWMDEIRGQPALGVFELASEAVARAVLWEVLPNSESNKEKSYSSMTWLDVSQTISESCRARGNDPFGKLPWWELCNSKSVSELDRANPMSLANWLAARLGLQLKEMRPSARMRALHKFMSLATMPAAMRLDRAQAWPEDAAHFGENLLAIEKLLGVNGLVDGGRPVREYQQLDLTGEQDRNVDLRFAVVASCVFPPMKQISKFEADEFVWVQSCDENRKLRPAKSAQEFAKNNPHVLLAKIGLEETRMAISRGWLPAETRITELLELDRSNQLHPNLQAQREEWNQDLSVLELHAPVDVLQFIRPLKN